MNETCLIVSSSGGFTIRLVVEVDYKAGLELRTTGNMEVALFINSTRVTEATLEKGVYVLELSGYVKEGEGKAVVVLEPEVLFEGFGESGRHYMVFLGDKVLHKVFFTGLSNGTEYVVEIPEFYSLEDYSNCSILGKAEDYISFRALSNNVTLTFKSPNVIQGIFAPDIVGSKTQLMVSALVEKVTVKSLNETREVESGKFFTISIPKWAVGKNITIEAFYFDGYNYGYAIKRALASALEISYLCLDGAKENSIILNVRYAKVDEEPSYTVFIPELNMSYRLHGFRSNITLSEESLLSCNVLTVIVEDVKLGLGSFGMQIPIRHLDYRVERYGSSCKYVFFTREGDAFPVRVKINGTLYESKTGVIIAPKGAVSEAVIPTPIEALVVFVGKSTQEVVEEGVVAKPVVKEEYFFVHVENVKPDIHTFTVLLDGRAVINRTFRLTSSEALVPLASLSDLGYPFSETTLLTIMIDGKVRTALLFPIVRLNVELVRTEYNDTAFTYYFKAVLIDPSGKEKVLTSGFEVLVDGVKYPYKVVGNLISVSLKRRQIGNVRYDIAFKFGKQTITRSVTVAGVVSSTFSTETLLLFLPILALALAYVTRSIAFRMTKPAITMEAKPVVEVEIPRTRINSLMRMRLLTYDLLLLFDRIATQEFGFPVCPITFFEYSKHALGIGFAFPEFSEDLRSIVEKLNRRLVERYSYEVIKEKYGGIGSNLSIRNIERDLVACFREFLMTFTRRSEKRAKSNISLLSVMECELFVRIYGEDNFAGLYYPVLNVLSEISKKVRTVGSSFLTYVLPFSPEIEYIPEGGIKHQLMIRELGEQLASLGFHIYITAYRRRGVKETEKPDLFALFTGEKGKFRIVGECETEEKINHVIERVDTLSVRNLLRKILAYLEISDLTIIAFDSEETITSLEDFLTKYREHKALRDIVGELLEAGILLEDGEGLKFNKSGKKLIITTLPRVRGEILKRGILDLLL